MSDKIVEPINPCKKDCPDRCSTCHTTCQKYLTYAEQYKVYKVARDKFMKDCNDTSMSIEYRTKFYKPSRRKR